MSYTLASILTPRAARSLRDGMLATLGAAGFPVASWRDGGVARTLVELTAEGSAQSWTLAATVARGALLELADGDWLTALARSHFGIEREAATFARGEVRLAAAVGTGPYTIGPAALVVSDGTRFYRSTNTAPVVVPAGGAVSVPVRAEGAGAACNAPSIALVISPALPGVTVTSPAVAPSSSWRTADARDDEGDTELRRRCRDRWATIASGFTREAVRYWCTSARFIDGTSVGCTRVGFGAVAGDGSYAVYVAGASGALSGPGRTRVAAVLDERKPITDSPAVVLATEATLVVAGTVQFKPGFNTTENRTAAESALRGHVNARDIGDASGIDLGALYAAIYGAVPGGVQDADLTSPPGDTPVAAGTVAVVDVSGLVFL